MNRRNQNRGFSIIGLLFLFIVAEGIWNNRLHPSETIGRWPIADLFDAPPPPPTATPEPITTPAVTQTSTSVDAPIDPAALFTDPEPLPNFACLTTNNIGLRCLNPDGKWIIFTPNNSNLPNREIIDLANCGNQAIALIQREGATLFDGDQSFIPLGIWDGQEAPKKIACNQLGDIWVTHFQGISRYISPEEGWITHPNNQFSRWDDPNVNDLTVSDDGTVWVISTGQVVSKPSNEPAAEWEIYETDGSAPYLTDIALNQEKRPIVTYGRGFLTLTESGWVMNEPDTLFNLQNIEAASDGTIWFETSKDGVIRFSESQFQQFDATNGLVGDQIYALALDSADRAWVATESGLNIWHNESWSLFDWAAEWRSSDLTGERINEIVVIGAGPQLPGIPLNPPVLETSPLLFDPFTEEEEDSETDFACLAAEFEGLNCISRTGTWSSYAGSELRFRADTISAMTTCADRFIAMTAQDHLVFYNGRTFKTIPLSDEIFQPADIACAPNGEIWVPFFEGVGRFDGQAWTIYDHGEITNDRALLISDVEITPDGTVWVLSSDTVATFDQSESWTVYDQENGLARNYFFQKMVLDNAGLPIVTSPDQLVRFDGTNWSEQQLDNDLFMGDLIIDRNNQIWVESFDSGLLTISPSLERLTTFDGLSSNEVNALATDSSGRLWVGTEFGLNITGAENGTNWDIYDQSNTNLVGRAIDHIAVIGAGPRLLSPDRSNLGSLSGFLRMRESGSGVTQIRVAVCDVENRTIEAECTPSELPLSQQSATVRGGRYRFTSLDAGVYNLFIDVTGAGDWQPILNQVGNQRLNYIVRPGENTEIEPILMPLKVGQE